MAENIKQVAVRIKALREIKGDSVKAAAKALNVNEQDYLKYEEGESDIPISFLYEFAAHYKVELTALLTGEEPRMHRYSLVRSGKGPSVERRKEYKYQDLAYNFAQKKMEVFLVSVDPKENDAPGHFNAHPGQEFNYVLEGTVKIFLENGELILNAGDSLYFDSGKSHAMVALNGKPARFIAVIL